MSVLSFVDSAAFPACSVSESSTSCFSDLKTNWKYRAPSNSPTTANTSAFFCVGRRAKSAMGPLVAAISVRHPSGDGEAVVVEAGIAIRDAIAAGRRHVLEVHRCAEALRELRDVLLRLRAALELERALGVDERREPDVLRIPVGRELLVRIRIGAVAGLLDHVLRHRRLVARGHDLAELVEHVPRDDLGAEEALDGIRARRGI